MPADPSIQAFIEREARVTREIARTDGDWALRDSLSVTWHTVSKSDAEAAYQNEADRLRRFTRSSKRAPTDTSTSE